MSVSRSDLWVGWWDDTQCYHRLCSQAHYTSLLPPTTLRLLLGWCSTVRYHLDDLSFLSSQRSWCVCRIRNKNFNFHVPIHHNSIFCLWTSSQDDSLEGRLVGFCRPGLMTVTLGPGCRHLLSQSELCVGVRLTNQRPAWACPGPSSQGEETAVSSVVVQCFSG